MKEKTTKVWSTDKTLVGTEESAEAVNWRCSANKALRKIAENPQEIPVPESLFNGVSGLEICNTVRKWLQ